MPSLLETVAQRILTLTLPHPVRVGVEGRAAAGKTTFADALAARLALSGRLALRAQFDDFHPPGHGARSASGAYTIESYYGEGYDYAAFRDLLLLPLGPGGDRRCRLALRDSHRDAPKGETILVPKNALVVIDGVFLAHRLLRGGFDFRIWLDVSFETMIERAAKRDVAWIGSEAEVRTRYITRVIPLHKLHEAAGSRADADLIIDMEDFESPRIVFPVPPTRDGF